MKTYVVTRTVEFSWRVEADSKEVAEEQARDMGEVCANTRVVKESVKESRFRSRPTPIRDW